jgi:hypothetical protein
LAKASIERTECQKDVTFLIIVGNIPEMPNLKRPGDSSLSRFSSISSFSHRRRRLAGQSKTKFSAGINWSLNQIIKIHRNGKDGKVLSTYVSAVGFYQI